MLRSRGGLATLTHADAGAATSVLKSPAVHHQPEGNGHTSHDASTSTSSAAPKNKTVGNGNGNGKALDRTPSFPSTGPAGLHAPRRRTSSGPHGHREEEPAAAWFDAPLALALVPTVGSFVTGGEHVRDFLLLLIMLFYLHQLIRVPWELYTTSRPRRHIPSYPSSEPKPEHVRKAELAQSELHSLSLFYLALTIISPLIGAYLLRSISAALLGQDYISWFSTIVFVLASGIRPWRHLIHLLRTRTLELQDAAQDGSSPNSGLHPDRRSLLQRVDHLEQQLADALDANAACKTELSRLQQALDQSSDELEKLVRRVSRKVEAERTAQTQRLEVLEAKLDALASKRALAPVVSVPSIVPSFFGSFFSSSPSPTPTIKSRRSAHRSRKTPQSLSRIPEDGELVLDDDYDSEELEWYERLMQVAFAPVRTLRLLFLFIVQMVRSVFFS
ncbi:hypothetical protein AURDEDRAFT_115350 [Auricularia subglabra TFB-10046 SS5]|nr:hypothetical protein AURDEDRAFT_115350 [Auricularia subglabra TFB-10046 SS5]